MKTTLLYDKAERPYAQYLIREIQSFKIPRTHKKACVSKAARLHHVQCVAIDTPELSNILKQSDFLIVLCSEHTKNRQDELNKVLEQFYEQDKANNINRIIPVINLPLIQGKLSEELRNNVKSFMPTFLLGDKTTGRDELLGTCIQIKGIKRVITEIAAKILEIEILHPPLPPKIKKILWFSGFICSISAAAGLYFHSQNIPFIPGVQLVTQGILPLHYADEIESEGSADSVEQLDLLMSATQNRIDIPTQAYRQALARGNKSAASTILDRLTPHYRQKLINNGITPDTIHEKWNEYISAGNAELIQDLILAKCDVNLRLQQGKTPLHLAVENNQADIVKRLLNANASMSITDDNFKLAADYASNECKEILQTAARDMLSAHNITKDNFRAHYELLCVQDNANTIALILTAYPLLEEESEEHEHPLLFAVKENKNNIFNLLIGRNISEDILNTTLIYVSRTNQESIMRALIKHGADVNVSMKGLTPLLAATLHSMHNNVQILCESGANVSIRHADTNDTPLDFAIAMGDNLLVNILLKHKAPVNAKHPLHQFTPLDIATNNIQMNHEAVQEILELLLEGGADPNINSGPIGMTPLTYAAYHGNADAVKLMLRKVEDINHKDANNLSALDWAHYMKHHDIVALLKDKGGKLLTDVKKSPLYLQENILNSEKTLMKNELKVCNLNLIQTEELMNEAQEQDKQIFKSISTTEYAVKKQKAKISQLHKKIRQNTTEEPVP